MIKVENIEVFGWSSALRGMRNPLESWDKSDSHGDNHYFVLGPNDLSLAQKLIDAGPSHSKFMRQIFISMDITAPLYWWKEMDTYKVGTVANSCSTMHKLASTPITRDLFSFDKELNDLGTWSPIGANYLEIFENHVDHIIKTCEAYRLSYLETKDIRHWRALIQLLPESWNQMRTWTADYTVLENIYSTRSNHKLSEWREFCDMIKGLAYGEELILRRIGKTN